MHAIIDVKIGNEGMRGCKGYWNFVVSQDNLTQHLPNMRASEIVVGW